MLAGALTLVYSGSVDSHADRAPGLPVTVIATDTLRDVAVAVYDVRRPRIYINPMKLQQFGPELTDFFMAHEFGHIRFHHTRANALNADRASRDAMIQLRELEADCYAAATLGLTDPRAVMAAVRFFSQMGPYRFDREHPSGSQRAARILACLPAPLPPAGN
jgi:Zn-dependent protease with chaperone function